MFDHRRGNNLPDIHGTRTSPRRFQIQCRARFRNPDTTRMRSFQRNGLVSNSNIRRLEPLERSALDHSLDTQGCSPCVDRVRTPHNIVGFRRKACHCRRCRKKSGQSNSGTDQLGKVRTSKLRCSRTFLLRISCTDPPAPPPPTGNASEMGLVPRLGPQSAGP